MAKDPITITDYKHPTINSRPVFREQNFKFKEEKSISSKSLLTEKKQIVIFLNFK